MKKFPTVIPVVAAALIDRAGRVLMQRRRLGAEHGGLWEFPGGKVEPGESLADSLCREIFEELGLELELVAAEAGLPGRAAKNPHRQPARGRFRMIVLAPRHRLSEAELRHE